MNQFISLPPTAPRLARRLLMLAFALVLLCGDVVMAGSSPKLYVFVPSAQKTRTVQKALRSSLSNLDVTVFGKSRDFEQAISRRRPAAVMALGPQLRALSLSTKLKSVRGGKAEEPYVLVTVDHAIKPSALGGETVGALGILNRSGMKSFCGKLLGTGTQRVKTVTKYEDLLPLLQFKSAKGVVLPKRLAGLLTKRSQLNLVVRDIPGGMVGLPAVAVLDGGAGAKVIGAVRRMNKTSKDFLGVEGWR